MALVAEILHSAGVLEKDNMKTKVSCLKDKIEDTKLEVQEILKNYYIDFIPQYVKLDKVSSSVIDVENEYENLQYHVEKEMKPQLSESIVEYQEMFDDLKKIKLLKQGVSDVLNLSRSFDTIKLCVEENFFVKAADNVLVFERNLQALSSESLQDVELIGAFENHFCVSRNKLIHTLMEFWHSRISINSVEGAQNCSYQIQLSMKTEPRDELAEVILALELLKELDGVLQQFGKNFITMICTPIVTEEIKFDKKNAKKGFMFTTHGKKKHLQPLVALEQFLYLFTYLNDNLFKWTYTREKSDDEKMLPTLMGKLGHFIHKDFCKLLIEKCLKPSVPSQSAELQNFHSVIDKAVNLFNLLAEIGFTSEDDSFKEFIDNVDRFPADKMTLELLAHSRDLMKKPLHKTVHVGAKELSSQQQGNETVDNMSQSRSNLSKSSFAFPSCQISEFARDLVELLEQVFKEAEDLYAKSPSHAIKLLCTARKVCELYCSVVSTYHKEEISNLPQQTAIHHNNCMYIAHRLLMLGAKTNIQMPVTFTDSIQVIRSIGAEAFLAQMRNQRHNILQILKDPGAFQTNTQDENIYSQAEKTVRQCLQQLELLKRVWSEVLPIDVYFKVIGTLLNTFLEEITSYVLLMEDIAAQTASQLDRIFTIVLKQSIQLFQVESIDKQDDVHTYVKKWFKFQELQLIMAASLREIVDRWTNGKGPLATHFTSDEVKHLIRALFQNTDRRATALSKIR